jgi:hypothetical protein
MSNEEFKRKIIDVVSDEEDVQVIEVVNVEDDTGPFPKIKQEKIKIEQTPQVTEEMEHYEKFELSLEETAETELMIRKRKNELKRLAYNQGLRHETYYLINKQFEKEIARHPPKNINEKHFNNKPEDYPKTLINQ